MCCVINRTNILCVMLTLFSFSTLKADLVGFWSFDDESADDLSGNGNDGELLGAEFSDDTPNGSGMSLLIDGGTVQVPHSDSLGMEDSMTIAYWMKADNFEQPSDWNGPMGKISDPREDGGWEMQRFGDQSRIDIRLDTSEGANSVRGNLTETYEDEWVHVAWTVDEGEFSAYLDGELINVGTYPHGDGFGNESDLFFGNRANCCAHIGLLDEIAIFNTVISDEEIANLAAGISPVDGGPVGTPGDYDGDNDLDVEDIAALIGAINGAGGAEFDVDGNGSTDGNDLVAWVKDLKKTWIGDANLDGEFNSSDFVSVFTAGKFETGSPASWAEGDWNGDGVFGSGDFVAAFTDGGFELGPAPAAQSVPEPASLLMIVTGLAALGLSRRRI